MTTHVTEGARRFLLAHRRWGRWRTVRGETSAVGRLLYFLILTIYLSCLDQTLSANFMKRSPPPPLLSRQRMLLIQSLSVWRSISAKIQCSILHCTLYNLSCIFCVSFRVYTRDSTFLHSTFNFDLCNIQVFAFDIQLFISNSQVF